MANRGPYEGYRSLPAYSIWDQDIIVIHYLNLKLIALTPFVYSFSWPPFLSEYGNYIVGIANLVSRFSASFWTLWASPRKSVLQLYSFGYGNYNLESFCPRVMYTNFEQAWSDLLQLREMKAKRSNALLFIKKEKKKKEVMHWYCVKEHDWLGFNLRIRLNLP